MSIVINNQEVELISMITDGSDADLNIYIVPKGWIQEKNLEKYDWGTVTELPEGLYAEIIKFPELQEGLVRFWEV